MLPALPVDHLWLAALVSATMAGCGAVAKPSAVVNTGGMDDEPAVCCHDHHELPQLSGRRVSLIGMYRPVLVRKRVGPLLDYDRDGNPANTVAIETDDHLSVMLEIYYLPRARRSAEERQRFAGRRVKVIGTLHEHTPSATDGSNGEVQTMTGPYVSDIETIELAGH
jgi:hypothetical protein